VIVGAGGALFVVKSPDLFVKPEKESESVELHHSKSAVWYLERDRGSYHFGDGYRSIMVGYAKLPQQGGG